MKLSRYQFEVLAYLERSGRRAYSMRTLSDSLKISASCISDCLDTMAAEGLIQRNGGAPAITESGLAALEPYRVKRAVIMAAGFGSRMMPATADRPKPMVTVNGVRIIDTLLDALVGAGIADITLVRGYKKERFDELLPKYPFLKLVDNDIYDSTNNISSAMAALDSIDNCYLCEADLYITNPGVITKYQYASNILGSYSLETDDWSFRQTDGHITQYQKGNTFCYNYYGISYWTPEDSARLRRDFRQVYEQEPGGRDYFWEFIPLVLRKENYSVQVRPCEKSDIMEIDNYFELAQLDPGYFQERMLCDVFTEPFYLLTSKTRSSDIWWNRTDGSNMWATSCRSATPPRRGSSWEIGRCCPPLWILISILPPSPPSTRDLT